jgi:hypothetical protein
VLMEYAGAPPEAANVAVPSWELGADT